MNNLPFIRSLKETSGIYCFPWALQQAVPAFQGERGVCPQLANLLGGEECWISRCKRTLVSELEVYLVMGEGRGKVAEERDVTLAKLVRKGLEMHPK